MLSKRSRGTWIDQRSENNQHLFILGNIEILCWTGPQEMARPVTLYKSNK